MKITFTALSLVCLAAGPSYAVVGETALVSRANGPAGAKGNGASREPRMSASGRYVAFSSAATNLVADDLDAIEDVYVRDVLTGTTTLVSRAAGASGAKGNGPSTSPDISADGTRVLFSSQATNLDPADTDAIPDVFVRDLVTGVTTLVSRATGIAGFKADAFSILGTISADGLHATFSSRATNLDPADSDNVADVYVRDLASATTALASRAAGVAGTKGTTDSSAFGISSDGGIVLLLSDPSLDPTGGGAPTVVVPPRDVYVRSLATSATILVSRASGDAGVRANDTSYTAKIAAGGRFVTFSSAATSLDPADADTIEDTYVRDLATATTTLISRANGVDGAKGNGATAPAAISADGRYVAFASAATNLDPADVDATPEAFVRDRARARTILVSRATGADGAKANGTSVPLGLSSDGRFVAFMSDATNLDPADRDSGFDIYVRDVLGPPGDRDGDRVADARDNCPTTANANQRDTDVDKIGDACDESVATPGPVLATKVVARVASGAILVRDPKSTRCRVLTGAQLLQTSSLIDATAGKVMVTSAKRATGGGTQTATLAGGPFKLTQKRARNAPTQLRLLRGEPPCKRTSIRAGVLRTPNLRPYVTVDGKGVRAIGRYAIAASIATKWEMREVAAGTRVKVFRGTVEVLYRRTGRTRKLRAPGSRTASAPRRR